MKQTTQRRKSALSPHRVPTLEQMEDRRLLTVITTNSQIELANAFNPAAPSPLSDISQLSGPQALGMIYTNQVSGIPGISGGIRTISAQLIKSAANGVTYPNVVGPNGGNLLAISALSGSLTAPGTANFNPSDGGSGTLFLYEQPAGTGFDRRDPASWLPAGSTLLTQFDLLERDDITQGANGEAIFATADTVNVSTPVGLLTGDSDITLLWVEDQSGNPDFLIVPDPSTPLEGVLEDEKLVTNAEQRTIIDAFGQDIDPGQPQFILDGADLAVLNSIASQGGLADLGVAGTGFATGYAVGTMTDYFIDLPSQAPDNLVQGDLVAQLSSENYPAKNVDEGGGGGHGCTPGFWKNNADKKEAVAWPDTVAPGDDLDSVGFDGFSVANGDATTFLEALSQKGGGENALMRHAAAAFLNAESGFYPLSSAEVLAAVNAALASGDAAIIEAVKDDLDDKNNLGCGLDMQGNSIESLGDNLEVLEAALASLIEEEAAAEPVEDESNIEEVVAKDIAKGRKLALQKKIAKEQSKL